MNYLPVESKVHEYKHAEPGERHRRRIARAIGVGAVATVALLVGFGTWSQSSRSADTIAVLEARNNALPNVRTMTVEEDKAPRTIELPGNMAASTLQRCLPAPRAISASAMSTSAARCTKGMCL